MSAADDATRFSDDLDAWLDAAAASSDGADERYVVDRTLRETPDEVTQVVFRRIGDGKRVGPFVRKRFAEDAGRGQAYEQILRAQTSGVHLDHQPMLYECERVGSSVDVIMEYLSGETLRTLVMREGPGIDVAKRVMPELCDAITELHESLDQPIIHRDVKPSNVMIVGDNLKLIDLGIARTYRADAAYDTVRYGTPGYAPPEQFGYGQTSVRSDVYALGMTLAFCLTAEDPSAQFRDQLLADSRVPASLVPVLLRATEFDPDRRYESAREFKEDFLKALDNRLASQKGGKLGRVWNALLLTVWAVLAVLCVGASIVPSGPLVEQYPRWFIPFIFLFFGLVPITAIVYLLLDKRRLRQREPFSKLTWRNEVPVCVGVSLACMLVVTIVSMLVRYK